jgi:hypothetical protein
MLDRRLAESNRWTRCRKGGAVMGHLTRNDLGPAAQGHYDRQKNQRMQLGRPADSPGFSQPTGSPSPDRSLLPLRRRPQFPIVAPKRPLDAVVSERTRRDIRGSKYDAEQFVNVCEKAGLPRPELEYRFHPTRMWRFDVAFVAAKIAVEIQGGVFIRGRHNSPVSFIKEMEKQNSAAVMGWRFIYRTPSNFLSFETADLVRRAMIGGRRV